MATYPVIDEDTDQAMVLGFASTLRGAMRIVLRYAKEREISGAIGVERITDFRVPYDPDLNTPDQAKRANAAAHGWVMRIAEIQQ